MKINNEVQILICTQSIKVKLFRVKITNETNTVKTVLYLIKDFISV